MRSPARAPHPALLALTLAPLVSPAAVRTSPRPGGAGHARPRRRRRPGVGARRGPRARSTRCGRRSRADQLRDPADPRAAGRDLAGPFGAARRAAGAGGCRSSSSADDTIWSFRLRPGVRFQDGIATERRRRARQRPSAGSRRPRAGADAGPVRGRRAAPRPGALLPRASRPGLSRATVGAADRDRLAKARIGPSPRSGLRRESRSGTGAVRASRARRRDDPGGPQPRLVGNRARPRARRWTRSSSAPSPTPTSASPCSPRATCRWPRSWAPSRSPGAGRAPDRVLPPAATGSIGPRALGAGRSPRPGRCRRCPRVWVTRVMPG